MKKKSAITTDKPTYDMLRAQIEMLENQNAELFAENHKVKHMKEVLIGLNKLADTFIDTTKQLSGKVDELDERMDDIMEALRKRRRDR